MKYIADKKMVTKQIIYTTYTFCRLWCEYTVGFASYSLRLFIERTNPTTPKINETKTTNPQQNPKIIITNAIIPSIKAVGSADNLL